MKPIREIEIGGVKRKALFSVFLWKRLEEEGMKVRLSAQIDKGDLHAQLAASCEFITIIYGALKNAIAAGIEQEYELTLFDVDCWATENKAQFYQLIAFILTTLVTGEKTEEGQVLKKKSSSKSTRWRLRHS